MIWQLNILREFLRIYLFYKILQSKILKILFLKKKKLLNSQYHRYKRYLNSYDGYIFFYDSICQIYDLLNEIKRSLQ